MQAVFAVLLLSAGGLLAQPWLTTAQVDNARTGANLEESVLTPRNVNAAQFGPLFVLPVDGDVYAQPLYAPRLEIPGKGVHNVLFVATEHDSLYAFDAAGMPREPLWHTSFLNPAGGVEPVPERAVQCPLIPGEVGITSTPVIDRAARTIYVLVRTSERDGNGRPLLYQRLHALDITTGAERPGSPVLIRASARSSTLFGLLSREVTFHSALENPRAAMLLSGGNVYIAWGSSCDVGPYYGWVLAYDSRTLKQTGVFNTSPDAGESGIWQSDAGIAADREGNVYAVTGNGRFNADSGGHDYGDSVLKLAFGGGALQVVDYFTPFDQEALNRIDKDLGSSGAVLLPDQPGAHPHLLVTAGKAGVVYLIDRDRMGHFHAGSDSHAVATVKVGTGAFGAPAFWNGHLYYANRESPLVEMALDSGRLALAHRSSVTYGHPGAIPAISANGARDGIVWLLFTKGPPANGSQRPMYGSLDAYDAADVSRQLYTTGPDGPGPALRFTIPAVVDGRVYIGVRGAVQVFGLLPRRAPATRPVRRP